MQTADACLPAVWRAALRGSQGGVALGPVVFGRVSPDAMRLVLFVLPVIPQSRVTFLEPYEVPSGGDWSIARVAAVFVESAEGITIANATFSQTGGNAVMFSNHVAWSSVQDSEFVHIGDSGALLHSCAACVTGSVCIRLTLFSTRPVVD